MSRTFVITCLTVTFVCLAITYAPVGCASAATEDAGTASAKTDNDAPDAAMPLDRWTYIEIDSTKAMWGDFDEPEWLRYFALATGDVDGDGNLDIVTGRNAYLNPGDDLTATWTKEDLGANVDATLHPYFQRDTGFVRERLVTQSSMNNLDLADLDGDGDLDVVTAEHKGERLALQAWVNDGAGGFGERPTEIDRSEENHLGARTVDIDGDGDLDIVGIGWDQHQYVHLWRNDAL